VNRGTIYYHSSIIKYLPVAPSFWPSVGVSCLSSIPLTLPGTTQSHAIRVTGSHSLGVGAPTPNEPLVVLDWAQLEFFPGSFSMPSRGRSL
jgi:hypothetical protein